MKNLILILIILQPLLLLSQTTSWEDKSKELYKVQRYYDHNSTNPSASNDGNLNVSKLNGNLTYSYNISSQKINGAPLVCNLNYSGGVNFKSFTTLGNDNSPDYSTFSQKKPAWILGVNGFAVQVFSKTGFFISKPHVLSDDYIPYKEYTDIQGSKHEISKTNDRLQYEQRFNFTNRDVNWVIPGYDYTNNIEQNGTGPGYGLNDRDKISILKSDGSLLELFNSEVALTQQNAGDINTYIGTYFENKPNSKSYAIVEYIDALVPESTGDSLDFYWDEKKSKIRRLRYFPGDGLEYEFIEYITPYGYKVFNHGKEYYEGDNVDEKDYSNAKGVWAYFGSGDILQSIPKIFYLRRIYNQSRLMTEIQYDRHMYDNVINSDYTVGRANLTHYLGHDFDFGNKSCIIKALNREINLKFGDGSKIAGTRPTVDQIIEYPNISFFGGNSEEWIEFNEDGIDFDDDYKYDENLWKKYFFTYDYLDGISKLYKENIKSLQHGNDWKNLANYNNGSYLYEDKFFSYILYISSITESSSKSKSSTVATNLEDQIGSFNTYKQIKFEYENYVRIFGSDLDLWNDTFYPVNIQNNNLTNHDRIVNIAGSLIQRDKRLNKVIEPTNIFEVEYDEIIDIVDFYNLLGSAPSDNDGKKLVLGADDLDLTDNNFKILNNVVKKLTKKDKSEDPNIISVNEYAFKRGGEGRLESFESENYDGLLNNEIYISSHNPYSEIIYRDGYNVKFKEEKYFYQKHQLENQTNKNFELFDLWPISVSTEYYKDNTILIETRDVITLKKSLTADNGAKTNLFLPTLTYEIISRKEDNQSNELTEYYKNITSFEYELTDKNFDQEFFNFSDNSYDDNYNDKDRIREYGVDVGSLLDFDVSKRTTKSWKPINSQNQNIKKSLSNVLLNHTSFENHFGVNTTQPEPFLKKIEYFKSYGMRQLDISSNPITGPMIYDEKMGNTYFLQNRENTFSNVYGDLSNLNNLRLSARGLWEGIAGGGGTGKNHSGFQDIPHNYKNAILHDLDESYCSLFANQANSYDPNASSMYTSKIITQKPLSEVLEKSETFDINGKKIAGTTHTLENSILEEYESNKYTFSYSLGKPLETKVYSDENFGNIIEEKKVGTFDYSHGFQGGGYLHEFVDGFGTKYNNYYIYNSIFHLKQEDSQNSFIEPYLNWNGSTEMGVQGVKDDDIYPCSFNYYPVPSGKVESNLMDVVDDTYGEDKLRETMNLLFRAAPIAENVKVRKMSVVNGSSPDNITFNLKNRNLTNLYEYDNWNNLTAYIDINGYLSSFKYDTYGRNYQVNLPYDFTNPNPLITKSLENVLLVKGENASLIKTAFRSYTCEQVEDEYGNDVFIRNILSTNGQEKPFLYTGAFEIFGNSENPALDKIPDTKIDGLYFYRQPCECLLDESKEGWDGFNTQLFDELGEQCSTNYDALNLTVVYSNEFVSDYANVDDAEKSQFILDFHRPLNVKQINKDNIESVTFRFYLEDIGSNFEQIGENEIISFSVYASNGNIDDELFNQNITNIFIYGDDNSIEMDGSEITQTLEKGYFDIELTSGFGSLIDGFNDDDYKKISLKFSYVDGHIVFDNNLGPQLIIKGTNAISYKQNTSLVADGDDDIEVDINTREDFLRHDYTTFNYFRNVGDFYTSHFKIDDKLHTSNPSSDFSNSGSQVIRTIDSKTEITNDYKPSINYIVKSNIDNIQPMSLNTSEYMYDATGKVLKATNNADISNFNVYESTGKILRTDISENQMTDDGQTQEFEYYIIDPTSPPNIHISYVSPRIQEFGGYCSVKLHKYTVLDENTEIEKVDLSYSDLFGNVLIEVEDFGNPDNTKIKTINYYYNYKNQLIKVINPKGQEIKYWYDKWGHILCKYQQDMGYTTYSYDKLGRIRFVQTEKDYKEDKIIFYQYDDLGRVTVSGDCIIDVSSYSNPSIGSNNGFADPVDSQTGEYLYNRLTDVLDPNIIHDSGKTFQITGLNTNTLNATLFFDNNAPDDKFITIDKANMSLISGKPLAQLHVNDILGVQTQIEDSVFVHEAKFYYDFDPFVPRSPTLFEDAQQTTSALKNINYYDDFPNFTQWGIVWEHIPERAYWERLCDANISTNSRGRLVASAYRETDNGPFYFVVYNYDARGRVAHKMKYTDNLGFDYVEYAYNSMDQVIKTRTVDPFNQHVTWYTYDEYGRFKEVFSKVYNNGHGCTNLSAPGDIVSLEWPTIPTEKQIEYTYSDRYKLVQKAEIFTNELDNNNNPITHNYSAIFGYGKQDRLNTILFYDDLTQSLLFHQDYSLSNNHPQILNSTSQHSPEQASYYTQQYSYDRINQLTGVKDAQNNILSSFQFDIIGNRTFSKDESNNGLELDYTYYNNTNRLQEVKDLNNIFIQSYTYYDNGAMKTRENIKKIVNPNFDKYQRKLENFEYNHNDVLYIYNYSLQTKEFNCDFPAPNPADEIEWRYLYDTGSEREQKRLYKQPGMDYDGKAMPWVYYLLDGNKKQRAVYHGAQITNDILQMQYGSIPEFQPNVWGGNTQNRIVTFWPTEYNVGTQNNFLDISFEYNIDDQQWRPTYKLKDNLGSIRLDLKDNLSSLNTYNKYDYSAYGEIVWKSGDKPRLEWIGKETDNESSLGDFGVRKYDHLIGRFNSTDPLFEKYYAWSPYMYSANNPIIFLDPSGLKFLEGTAPDGFDWSSQYAINEKPTDEKAQVENDNSAVADATSVANTNNSCAEYRKAIDYTRLDGGDIVTDVYLPIYEFAFTFWGGGTVAKLGMKALFKLGSKQAVKQLGLTYSKHALKRMVERGFTKKNIARIINKGKALPGKGRYGPQVKYEFGGNTVVVNSKNEIVTVFSNNMPSGNFIPFK